MNDKLIEQEVIGALREASQLYDNYVQLARLADFAGVAEEETLSDYSQTLDRPLGLVITTE